MYQIYDPGSQTFANGTYTRAPFPNNLIPQTRIDPISKSIHRVRTTAAESERCRTGAGHFHLHSQQLHLRR
jgi:hypothetical protein